MHNWYKIENSPKFENPPVVETVIGVQFSPNPKTSLIDLASLQKSWVEDYPVQSHHLIEVAPQLPIPTGVFVPRVPPVIRFWSETTDGHGLVQSELGRLILNWRKTNDLISYPGFEHQLDEYRSLWSLQTEWEQRLNANLPLPFEIEITYVNDLGQITEETLSSLAIFGEAWNTFPGRNGGMGFSFQRNLDVSEGHPYQGKLSVSADTNVDANNRSVIFVTCSTTLLVMPNDDLNEALSAAHALTVNAFAASISKELSSQFGRKL